ncbi:hypothetical protein EON63_23705 [archaeon]|nr:MAG: hypothetical protein EON63_23705 [archaeon]
MNMCIPDITHLSYIHITHYIIEYPYTIHYTHTQSEPTPASAGCIHVHSLRADTQYLAGSERGRETACFLRTTCSHGHLDWCMDLDAGMFEVWVYV